MIGEGELESEVHLLGDATQSREMRSHAGVGTISNADPGKRFRPRRSILETLHNWMLARRDLVPNESATAKAMP